MSSERHFSSPDPAKVRRWATRGPYVDHDNLSLAAPYVVVREEPTRLLIEDDTGDARWYPREWFGKVREVR